MKQRNEGFRIGTYRGRLLPSERIIEKDGKTSIKEERREYKLQRDIYLIGRLRTPDENDIRVFAYEIPLEKGNRTASIDLLGYDRHRHLYIIEVKGPDAKDSPEDVYKQLKRYKEAAKPLKSNIEKEFNEAFLLEGFKFKDIKAFALAPKAIFDRWNIDSFSEDLQCFYPEPTGKELKLVEESKGKGYVKIEQYK